MKLNKFTIKNTNSIVKEIYNFSKVIDLLGLTNNKDILVIFDVDDVLMTPSSEDNLRHPYRNQLLKSILNRTNPQEIELLKSSIFLNTKQILVELKIIDIFEYLKSHKIPAIALTAMGTGKFGIIKKMHDFRFQQLNSVNLSFKCLTPLEDEHLMLKLAIINKRFLDANRKGCPMLKSGIIFASGLDKGMVLEYIFKRYNYYPKTIIFIDDLIENVKSLQQICFKLNINFYGFHYMAASLIPLPNIDENLEKLRFAILEKEFTWLSYEKLQDEKYTARLIV